MCTGSKGLVCEYLLYRYTSHETTNQQLAPTQATVKPWAPCASVDE
jgi:hypothetical protein